MKHLRFKGLALRVFRVWGLGLKAWGFGFRVSGLGFGGSELWV